MWSTFPLFGSTLLLAIMVVASYTFAVALAAGGSGRVKTLHAARLGSYATVALIGAAVLCLAYAFVSHDFRLRYVAHYSDRSMPWWYLLTALWGGQDGSLLWWMFLMSIYIGVCVYSLGNKHLHLQPYIIATLMGVVIFFCVLMAFAANPFATGISGARTDGEGLNPLLQNFYMIIHPPSLYIGFVGCSIPFAFAISALVTGRLDAEWILACRKFTIFALLFLAIGNTLGMLWAYEELGWGGYWAWDPVENAAFMPLLVIGAFAHSVMIQERRGMLKVWNVFLICLTFFMTIFGTFLTRSGAIASVHSFAQSSIGEYFVWFLVFLFAFCATLIMYRWPELRGYTPTPQLRKAAIVTGWVVIGGILPGLFALLGKFGEMAAPVRVAIFTIGIGFAVYAGIEIVFRRMTMGMKLKAERPRMESVLSREFTFLLNNFGLLGFMGFVLVATTFPMVSEALWNEKVTVGPPYYNVWLQPLGLGIFFLMGVGTLFGRKKTSDAALKRAFVAPAIAWGTAVVLHFAIGKAIGHPAIVLSEPIYGGVLGAGLRYFNAVTPVLGVSLVVFNAAVIVQEFVFLYRSRVKAGAERSPRVLFTKVPIAVAGAFALVWLVLWKMHVVESAFTVTGTALAAVAGFLPGAVVSIVTLPATGRRRYGGYIVHLGIVFMFFGFTGKSWTIDREVTLSPGQSVKVQRYDVQYVGPKMDVDNSKRMVFADIKVTSDGKELGRMRPAKFIYKKMPESPTTEVDMLHSIRDDLYLVVGSINPETKVASLQIHVNPLVSFIWFGCFALILFGCTVCMWPELEPEESKAWRFARGASAVAVSTTLAILLALLPVPAYGQTTATQHAGSVQMDDAKEKQVFGQLRCMCGTCPRELLSTCACSTADQTRERLRMRLSRGETPEKIIDDYVEEFGTASLAIPPNKGGMRAIYTVPLVAIAGAGIALAVVLKRWRKNSDDKNDKDDDAPPAKRDDYDDRIDADLKDLDE